MGIIEYRLQLVILRARRQYTKTLARRVCKVKTESPMKFSLVYELQMPQNGEEIIPYFKRAARGVRKRVVGG